MSESLRPGRVVCFGEVLLRLSSPPGWLMLQAPNLEVCTGGAEANVAVSLSRLGHPAALVTTLPDNILGQAAIDSLRAHGVDMRGVRCADGRMGLYFLAPGAVLRPSEIVYDRAGSAFALADPAHYDWPALLQGASWLHVSGISPAVGDGPAQTVLDAMRTARQLGVRVAFDGNYRASLWSQRGSDGAGELRELFSHADLAFAGARDIALMLQRPELVAAGEDEAAAAAFAAFPQLSMLAATSREQHSVDQHDLSAALRTRGVTVSGGSYRLSGIVDRIGTGDAFAAGLLFGLERGRGHQDAIGFALAAAAMKHAIAGDFNLASASQIDALRAGGLDVRR